MKKIVIFLILVIYSFTVLAAEVPPQPTPPGPTGPQPGPGTGTGHDQPVFGPREDQVPSNLAAPLYNAGRVGFNMYYRPRFSSGNNVLSYSSSICQNDKVNVELDMTAEWFGKGGTMDSPPVQFYDLSIDEIKKKLEDKTLEPEPKIYRVSLFSVKGTEWLRQYGIGNMLCSRACSDIPEIQTSQLGVAGFDFKCTISCILFTVKFDKSLVSTCINPNEIFETLREQHTYRANFTLPEQCNFQNSILDRVFYLYFNNCPYRSCGLQNQFYSRDYNMSFSTQFNVVSALEGPKLSMASYSYNNGQLLLTIQNDGDTGARIDNVQFDKAATEMLKPDEIAAGSKANFIYSLQGEDIAKMDVSFTANDIGCLQQTNFQVSYNLDLAAAKTPTPQQTPTQKPLPAPKIPPTKPIEYGNNACEPATDVNNIKISVGGFGVSQYSVDSLKKGESATIDDPNIVAAIEDRLKYCPFEECIVPIKIKADDNFRLNVKDIKIEYK